MTTDLPQISVLLPIYNGEKYLEKALTSILEQDFTDFEVVAINDGSIDGTLDILEQMAGQDKRIRILTQKNAGLVSALNWGLSEARADIIARMDSDDIAYKTRFSKQLQFLKDNPDIGLVFSQMNKINEFGESIGKKTNTPISTQEVAQALSVGNCLPHHPTIMARKTEMQAAGGYREIFKGAEDLDLWYRMSKRTKLAGLTDVLLDYRLHSGQVTQRTLVRQRFSQDLIILIAREMEAGRPDPSKRWQILPDFNWDETSPELLKAPSDIIMLFRYYRLIDHILNQQEIETLEISELFFLLDVMRKHSFFGSAKSRQILAHHLIKEAKRRKLNGLKWRAIFFAIRLNPSRALRHQFKPF